MYYALTAYQKMELCVLNWGFQFDVLIASTTCTKFKYWIKHAFITCKCMFTF